MANHVKAFQYDSLIFLHHEAFVPYALEELGILLALVDRKKREDRRISLALFDRKGYLSLHGERLEDKRRQRGGCAPDLPGGILAYDLDADRPCGRQEDEQLAEVVDKSPKRLPTRPVACGAIAVRLLVDKCLMEFLRIHAVYYSINPRRLCAGRCYFEDSPPPVPFCPAPLWVGCTATVCRVQAASASLECVGTVLREFARATAWVGTVSRESIATFSLIPYSSLLVFVRW